MTIVLLEFRSCFTKPSGSVSQVRILISETSILFPGFHTSAFAGKRTFIADANMKNRSAFAISVICRHGSIPRRTFNDDIIFIHLALFQSDFFPQADLEQEPPVQYYPWGRSRNSDLTRTRHRHKAFREHDLLSPVFPVSVVRNPYPKHLFPAESPQ